MFCWPTKRDQEPILQILLARGPQGPCSWLSPGGAWPSGPVIFTLHGPLPPSKVVSARRKHSASDKEQRNAGTARFPSAAPLRPGPKASAPPAPHGALGGRERECSQLLSTKLTEVALQVKDALGKVPYLQVPKEANSQQSLLPELRGLRSRALSTWKLCPCRFRLPRHHGSRAVLAAAAPSGQRDTCCRGCTCHPGRTCTLPEMFLTREQVAERAKLEKPRLGRCSVLKAGAALGLGLLAKTEQSEWNRMHRSAVNQA